MPKSSHQADPFETGNTGGLLSGFLAEEDHVDRSFLFKLGTWGAATVGAVVVALMANQSSLGWRRDQTASVELTRQLQQVQLMHRESQNEARRLASAIETLNGDRDRLFSRVTALETGLDTATGTLAKQGAAPSAPQAPLPSIPTAPTASSVTAPAETQPAPQASNPAPAVAQVATVMPVPAPVPDKKRAVVVEPVPATVSSITPAVPDKAKDEPKEASKEAAKEPVSKPAAVAPVANITSPPPAPLVASPSIMAPPDPAATKLSEPASPANSPAKTVVATTIPEATSPPVVDSDAAAGSAPVAVQHTEFAIDLGSANSLSGLRALWRGLLKSNSALAALRPIVMVKESNTGFGMQLRLAAGPLSDAATAARICAALIEGERTCETTVFDGQRLAMKADDHPATTTVKPSRPTQHRRSYYPKRAAAEEPAPKPEPTTFSSLFSRR